MYRKMCILRQQTSPKRWFGNRTMMSFCDVTNSAHQIQMTTLCRWMNPPLWKVSAYATEPYIWLRLQWKSTKYLVNKLKFWFLYVFDYIFSSRRKFIRNDKKTFDSFTWILNTSIPNNWCHQCRRFLWVKETWQPKTISFQNLLT